tara:strand:+ start:44 stop:700 length:657 start_codon:yes stop_codon:yes gene_type:complete
MPKKCPPGVFCLENITIFIIVILIVIFSVVLFGYQNKVNQISNAVLNQTKNIKKLIESRQDDDSDKNIISTTVDLPSTVKVKTALDKIQSIDKPPFKFAQGMPNSLMPRGGVPINVPTQGRPHNPQQMGILTRVSGPTTILPLMGQQLITNRDMFRYYTISDSNLNIRLPVSHAGKNCTSEYGCDEIFDGDIIQVEGYNDLFKATVYENANYQYIPYV